MASETTKMNVIVTGASRGIGKHIVLMLRKQGHFVAALSRDLERMKSLYADDDGEVACVQCDMSSVESIDETMAALNRGSRLYTGLVCNAGVANLAPFLQATVDDFDRSMSVNCRAPFRLAQLFAANLIERNGGAGSIVNVSSQASLVALAEHSVYCASKSALDSLTRVIAAELGEHGIRCNAVCPTVVLTEMSAAYWGKPEIGEPMKQRIPLRRFAMPDDVAELVSFLLDERRSSMITGTSIPIDGGYTAI
jgi:L-xylulose reductase